jgi:hypothetical protein
MDQSSGPLTVRRLHKARALLSRKLAIKIAAKGPFFVTLCASVARQALRKQARAMQGKIAIHRTTSLEREAAIIAI